MSTYVLFWPAVYTCVRWPAKLRTTFLHARAHHLLVKSTAAGTMQASSGLARSPGPLSSLKLEKVRAEALTPPPLPTRLPQCNCSTSITTTAASRAGDGNAGGKAGCGDGPLLRRQRAGTLSPTSAMPSGSSNVTKRRRRDEDDGVTDNPRRCSTPPNRPPFRSRSRATRQPRSATVRIAHVDIVLHILLCRSCRGEVACNEIENLKLHL
jgi:hypothetical protein